MASNDNDSSVQISEVLPSGVLEVREDTAGTWSYHLGNVNDPAEALCGERVMGTGIQLHQWGNDEGQLPISFCKECEQIAIQRNREGTW
jgi:hypothetical protein